MRFWFAAISPYYQSISSGDFREFTEKWQALKGNFSIALSNLLIRDLVMQSMREQYRGDPITTIGTYYDKQIRIEILAVRKSGKLLAGECKYSQKVAQPNMSIALKEKCTKAELDVSDYVLFSKNGFAPEMEQMRGDEMTLLSHENLASLLDNLTEEDLLVYTNRKY
jgi:hypothetical protein